MPNQTQIECFFKSSELAALCKQGKDIIINFTATYPPNSKPTFEITANVYKKGTKKASAKGMLAAGDGGSGGGTGGCPMPC